MAANPARGAIILFLFFAALAAYMHFFMNGGNGEQSGIIREFYSARMQRNYTALASLYADYWNYSAERAENVYGPVDRGMGRLENYSILNASAFRWDEGGEEKQAATVVVNATYENGEAEEVLNLALTEEGWRVDGWLIDVESSGIDE